MDKSDTTNKKSSERKLLDLEFNQVKFPAQTSDIFRVTISGSSDSVVLWVESKKHKNQWQATVSSIGDHGPASVPPEAVLAFLKKALELAHLDCYEEKREKDDPNVDLHSTDGEVLMALTLSMGGGIWRPEFKFPLLPVGLEKVDVLEAKVRDAQEEIELLKVELELVKAAQPALFNVSSKTTCASQQIVVWNSENPRVIDGSHFAISNDNNQVTIKQDGLYQVYVRLSGTNSQNGYSLGLQLNGVEIAQCTQSDANGHQNTAQLTEILHLEVNDVLQVRCGCNSNSLAVPNANRFTVMYLRA